MTIETTGLRIRSCNQNVARLLQIRRYIPEVFGGELANSINQNKLNDGIHVERVIPCQCYYQAN